MHGFWYKIVYTFPPNSKLIHVLPANQEILLNAADINSDTYFIALLQPGIYTLNKIEQKMVKLMELGELLAWLWRGYVLF